jgi:ferredoxin
LSDIVERQIGRYTIRIDRNLCVGFGDCITDAPEVFALGDDGIIIFLDFDTTEEERVIAACRACPVDALTAIDENGKQVAP